MVSRIRFNTKDLQREFPSIYQNFFSKCSIVASSNRSMALIGGFSSFYEGLGMVQKLPIKTYVGLEPTHSQKIKIAKLIVFNPSKRKFEESFLDYFIIERLENFLNNQFPKIYNLEQKQSYNIYFLSEFPVNRGMNAVGASVVALATAISLFNNLVSHDEIKSIPSRPTQELKDNEKFNFIFKLALKIESLFYLDDFCGLGPYSAMIDSKFPIVFFLKKKKFILDSSNKEKLTIFDQIDQSTYWGFRFDEFFSTGVTPNWPIQFGLIYSGDMTDSSNIIHSTQDIQNRLKNISRGIKNILYDNFKIFKKDQLPTFYRAYINKDGKHLWQQYVQILNTLGLETFINYNNILEHGFSEWSIKLLFESINREHQVSHLLDLSSSSLDYIHSFLNRKAIKMNLNFGIGAKTSGIGKRGDILFLVANDEFCNSINKIINELRKEMKKDIWLDYASWIDGFGEDGIRIDQFLEQKIYSKYISPKSIYIKSLDKKGNVNINIYTPEQFNKENKNFDILLDEIEDKIYIKGKLLTSKNIHSAKVTIEIMRILINNLGREVSSSILPPSSYIDRNEMQGKIISPLKKSCKKRLGRELPLIISGGLRKNFSLKLEPSNLKVYIKRRNF